MSEQIYIIGDVHGCFNTLLELIKQFPNKEKSQICFVGDVIDRGLFSCDVVELIMQNGYKMVMGNHERRLLSNKFEFLNNKVPFDRSWFFGNGGEATYRSYLGQSVEFKQRHVDFLETRPVYLEFKEYKTQNGEHLVVSHSAVGNMWELRNDKYASEEFKRHLLSGRGDEMQVSGIFNVYGHTPVREVKFYKNSADIDTGCVFNEVGFDKLSALEFPSMKIYTQRNVENFNKKDKDVVF
ncbi:serine/threonine protein phosphatase [Campylobacter concisus]|uniref:Serine/threonine protein phosphatase n=1 Tax=Campylobacter concisus TaxID=199 RepID=A0A1Y5N900_9BACT|nr:metallophosphoesterase [Campylobacter concisus]OUT17336.1 serine/threonine protein phosphatase [Campylobacter concisus]